MLGGVKLKEAFDKNAGPSMGVWQCLPGSNVSRTLASIPGIDWVMVDTEHGNIDDGQMHEAVPAITACGKSPIVRIPDMQGWMVKRALDAGAHGILVPLLRTADEARELVAASKFPPLGKRGFGSPFAMGRFNPPVTASQYLQQANESLLTMVQIETQEAVDAVDEIAAVPGLDVLLIGPFDLGNNIGHPIIDGVVKDELKATIERILTATKKAGKKAGMFAATAQQAKFYADLGFDMISVTLDVGAMAAGVMQSVMTAKGQEMPKLAGGY